MSHEPMADATSCTLRIDATATWAEAEAAAEWAGLTLGYIVDTVPDRTIQTTLQRPEWLPPLWPPHTARAATIALAATGDDGQEYGSVVAPRTASGPDMRSLFLGADGRFGEVTSVTLRCERLAPVGWWRAADISAALPVVVHLANVFGSVLTVHGDDDGMVVRVREGLLISEVAVRKLKEAGFSDQAAPNRTDANRVLAVAPWDAVVPILDAGAPGKLSPTVIAAGPTHAAISVTPTAGQRKGALRWAEEAVASAGTPARIVVDGGGRSAAADAPLVLGEVVA